MKKDELEKLFEHDLKPFYNYGLEVALLNSFDKVILNNVDETFSDEVLGVYTKFVSMKQEAPEKMKNNLFGVIRNFAKVQASNNANIEALVLYRFLAVKSELMPDDFIQIAELLALEGDKNTAKKFMQLYETKETNKPLAFITMANFYNLKIQDYKTAIKYYEKYLQIDKSKSVIYTIVGNLYSKVYGDSSLDEQIFYFEKANKLKPNDRLILHALAFCYEKTGNKELTLKYYTQILNNNPTEIDYYNYGAFRISAGDFEEGHKYFTHRFNIDDENLKYPINLKDDVRWDLRSDISDKILLVHYEQGFGDTFMYCRFVPSLKNLCKKIIFVVQDSLYDLIKNSKKISSGIEIVSDKTDISKLKYDVSMALLDAPYALNISSSAIPLTEKYLEVSQKSAEEYRNKYLKQGGNLKIGLAYSGDVNANYSGRDIDVDKFNILADIEGVDLYSLQVGAEITNQKITDLSNSFETFTQTAQAISNMDIIVSTDNVILNLAGALGVKTLGLFNKQTNFRWFNLENNVGWYKSVEPIQAKTQNDWQPVIRQVINRISQIDR